MNKYSEVVADLRQNPRKWVVTGVGGFIGSNLAEELLRLGQSVVGLDSFVTGHRRNLQQLQASVTERQWGGFTFVEGDIRDLATCLALLKDADFVLHQAALGSVPRSIAEPSSSHESNVTGFLNILIAARDQTVKRLVYASSSAIYGDHSGLPKREDVVGRPLSPYAATKLFNEIYADVFGRCYSVPSIGLRYFNVFGPRQDPAGAYAAVIPKWIEAMIKGREVVINGDGETSRDFCYVANVVQANILAAKSTGDQSVNQAYNVAVNGRTTLNELFEMLRVRLLPNYPHLSRFRPVYAPFRSGDVRHSQADITKAVQLLGYEPSYTIEQGIDAALEWYRANL